MHITENLRKNDLKNLVNKVFDIDAYKSKIGDDENVVVLCFTVEREDPAKDLENFVEMGYDFVLDADVSPGETEDGMYKVFVELERTRHVPEQILTLLDGIERLTGMPDMRFRYFKSFKSHDVSIENLTDIIPTTVAAYKTATERLKQDNYSNFFANSTIDDVSMFNENITFKKQWFTPLTMRIVDSGSKRDLYESISGPIMLESKDISEVLFYTKYIGNYNITKVGNVYIFENGGWAVAMERL